MLEFDEKILNWDGGSTEILVRGKMKGYKNMVIGKEKILTNDEFELALLGSAKEDKAVKKLGELNEEAYEDIILSINHTSNMGKVAFSLVKICVSTEYLEGNCKLACDCLVEKYAPQRQHHRC